MLGVIGHWISKQGQIHHTLLGLRKMEGLHICDNECALVWRIIQEYELQHRVGFFTFDNATNNAVSLRRLATYLIDYGSYNFSIK